MSHTKPRHHGRHCEKQLSLNGSSKKLPVGRRTMQGFSGYEVCDRGDKLQWTLGIGSCLGSWDSGRGFVAGQWEVCDKRSRLTRLLLMIVSARPGFPRRGDRWESSQHVGISARAPAMRGEAGCSMYLAIVCSMSSDVAKVGSSSALARLQEMGSYLR